MKQAPMVEKIRMLGNDIVFKGSKAFAENNALEIAILNGHPNCKAPQEIFARNERQPLLPVLADLGDHRTFAEINSGSTVSR
jgi:hypothetical protein